MLRTEAIEFYVEITGENTGETYRGQFQALPRLSLRLELQRDKRRRELLGENPQAAAERAVVWASVLADLSVRLTSWPKWWADLNMGLDLEDESVLAAIQEKITKIIETETARLVESGKLAKEALKKEAAKE
jgi:hypothetical protein